MGVRLHHLLLLHRLPFVRESKAEVPIVEGYHENKSTMPVTGEMEADETEQTREREREVALTVYVRWAVSATH